MKKLSPSTLVAGIVLFITMGWLLYQEGQRQPATVVPQANESTDLTESTEPLRSSTSLLNEYNEPHLNQVEANKLIADIHDAKKFVETKEFSLVGDCGTSENTTLLKLLDSQRKVQVINTVYPVLRTPNPVKWTITQAEDFMNDPTVVCGVGFFFPFEVTPDYILWRMACSSGMIPTDEQDKLMADFRQCIQAEEVISIEYNLED